MARPHWIDSLVRVGAHAGLRRRRAMPPTRDELTRRADLALRAAAQKGPGAIVTRSSMRSTASRRPAIHPPRIAARARLREELERALPADRRRRMAAASSASRRLLRWTHAARGADRRRRSFIPVAEQMGLMDTLGAFVLRRALSEAKRWPDLYISVNLSPLQVRDRGIVELVRTALAESGVPPSRLMLEITEGVLIDNPDEMVKRIEDLHALGVRIALDDFGSGYSNLGYLQRFPFDKLKIDKSFVAALGATPSNGGVIIQAIVALGRALGLRWWSRASRPRSSACCCGWPAATRCRAICSPGRPRPRPSTGCCSRRKAGRRSAHEGRARLTALHLTEPYRVGGADPEAVPFAGHARLEGGMTIPNAWAGLRFRPWADVEMLRKSVSGFAQDRIAPRADEIDRKNEFPRDLWPEMGALGLHGITVEEEYGGAGLGYLAHCVAMEEISRAQRVGRACPTARIPISASTRFAATAATSRSSKYLPKLISGEHVGALAMSEPGAGSDVVSMRTRADKKGDRYVLNGSKMWITNGPVADTLVVYAKTDRTAGARGITAFIVEKGMKGFAPAQKLDKLGMRGSDTSELVFTDCEVPEENVLGAVGNGVNVLMSGLDYERVVLAAGPLGIMQACMDVGDPLRARAPAVRPADRPLPAGAGQARRHVCDHERGQVLRVYGGAGLRRRPHHARGRRRRHSLRRRARHLDGAGGDPVPGRQRLHQRFSHRPPAARRQALRDRGGHQRNPPHADRAGDFREDADSGASH